MTNIIGSQYQLGACQNYHKNLFYDSTGSFSFSILSGKIMFRDVVYVTQDLSFRWVRHLIFHVMLHYITSTVLFY